MRGLGLLLGAAVWLIAGSLSHAQQAVTSGYDAQGRLQCVRYVTGGVTRTVTYTYDAAGNRGSVTTNSASCASSLGTPPVPPADPNTTITVTNPSITLDSQGSSLRSAASLGSASDGYGLSLVASVTGGSLAACGSVSHTAAQLTYIAPTVSPAGTTASCWVDYTLAHPAGQQKVGRITYTINGTGSAGGGGDLPGDCVPNPLTGMCDLE